MSSKRNWSGWVKRLGLQQDETPRPTLVTLVGDERELGQKWAGPRGRCGGGGIDGTFGIGIQILAGLNGAEVAIFLETDGQERIWSFFDNNPANYRKLGYFTLGTDWEPIISWTGGVVGTTRVATWDAAQDDGGGNLNPAFYINDAMDNGNGGVNGSGHPDCYTSKTHITYGWEDKATWEWIAPGSMLTLLVETSALVALGIRIREHQS